VSERVSSFLTAHQHTEDHFSAIKWFGDFKKGKYLTMIIKNVKAVQLI